MTTKMHFATTERRMHSEQTASCPFAAEEIQRTVTRTSPGVYWLGYLAHEQFIVTAVGRADEDLKDELSVRLMMLLAADLVAGPEDELKDKYARFAFCYTATAAEAFERECLAYHEVIDNGGTLQDPRHPSMDGDASENARAPRSFCPIWQCAWNY